MSSLEAALPVVFSHEVGWHWQSGGFTDDPNDPGGPTKWGVSLRWLRTLGDDDGDGWLDGDLDRDGDVDVNDIRALDREDAAGFYGQQWWDRYGYDRIAEQKLATKVLDLAINMGAGRAHRLLQQAVRGANNTELKVDGIIGPRTLAAANDIHVPVIIAAYRGEAAGYYRELVAVRNVELRHGEEKPPRAQYLAGWLNRAYW